MKKIYILMLMLLGTAGFAQNSAIFGGGIGDGWSYGSHMQWTNNIYGGGNGDGWSSGASSLTVLAVNEISQNSKIVVYPNPAHDKLIIECISFLKSANVYDMNGRCVLSVLDENTVNVSNLATGTYCLMIETSEGTAIKKIVKK